MSFALLDLFERANTTNFRLEILDVVFHHLQQKWMDPPIVSSFSTPTERYLADQLMVVRARNAAICATRGMFIAAFYAPEHLHSRVAERIKDHLGDYIGWLRYLLSGNIPQDPTDKFPLADPSDQCGTLLSILKNKRMGPLLGPAVMDSNSIVEYLIAAWSAINPRTGHAYLDFELVEECPILELFSHFLSRTDTQRMINDSLHYNGNASRNLRDAVIKAAISRCIQIAEMDKEALEEKFAAEYDQDPDMEPVVWSAAQAAFDTLDHIFHTVAQLCEHPCMAASVMKSAFLEQFTRALDIWLTKKTSRDELGDERMLGFRLMHAAHGIVEEQARQFGGAYWKLSRTACMHLLRGGSLSVLCEGMRSIPVNDEEESWLYIRECLVHLQNQCFVHPALCQPARLELTKILGDDFWRTQAFEPSGWTKYWKSAALLVVASCLTPFQRSMTLLCDNLYVRYTSTSARIIG